MKKLLILAPMLAWSGVAMAQEVDLTGSGAAQTAQEAETDQCTEANQPVVNRVDISPREASESGTVLDVAIAASLPHGNDNQLTYVFYGQDGTIVGNGANATWSVPSAGSFNATVEVQKPGSVCTAFAYLTYTAAQGSANDGE
jgi:hypothetical protein